MTTDIITTPEPLARDVLGSSYADVFVVPAGKGATVRGIIISNGDVSGGVPTQRRVWLHICDPLETPDLTNHELYDQTIVNGIDFDGVLTMSEGQRIVAKADTGGVVAIVVSGALTEVVVTP